MISEQLKHHSINFTKLTILVGTTPVVTSAPQNKIEPTNPITNKDNSFFY